MAVTSNAFSVLCVGTFYPSEIIVNARPSGFKKMNLAGIFFCYASKATVQASLSSTTITVLLFEIKVATNISF